MLPLLFALAFAAAGQRGLPASEGITNFGRVNEMLFRGAQPDAPAVKHLQALGVKTIINLRKPGKTGNAEASAAAVSGVNYTNVPMSGVGRPKEATVRKIISLIESSPAPVFVHCEHGCDRTGTIIACYRIEHDHWTGEAALREAEKYGISKLERGMRSFIADFARAEARTAAKPTAAAP